MSANTISTLIIDLLPVLTFLAVLFFQWFAQRLPDKQREALGHFADIAVRRTEQLFSATDNATKKQIATQLVGDLFHAFNLPLPNAAAVDAAIEAAVWALPSRPADNASGQVQSMSGRNESQLPSSQPVTPQPVEQPAPDGSSGL